MKFRIITHGGCTDGYASAFIVKKYTSYFLPEHDSSKIDVTEVRGLQPKDIQLGLFDVRKTILSLTCRSQKKKFCCGVTIIPQANLLKDYQNIIIGRKRPAAPGIFLILLSKKSCLSQKICRSLRTRLISWTAQHTQKMTLWIVFIRNGATTIPPSSYDYT